MKLMPFGHSQLSLDAYFNTYGPAVALPERRRTLRRKSQS